MNREPSDRSEASGDGAAPLDAAGVRIGLAVSTYHRAISTKLEEGAMETFVSAGGVAEHLVRVAVPGSFELVPVAAALARRPDIDGVVALGCIVRGETRHDRCLADAVAGALAALAAETGKAVGFGVLTVESMKQAKERSTKGAETMAAVLSTIRAIREIRA